MKKKKACVVAALGIVICVAAGTGFYFYRTQKNEMEIPALPEGMSLSENAVSAAGLTSVGMSEETCELGFLEDGLYVEETYLSMGDEVEEGTAVFKVSEESLESARRELEKQVQETALNRRQGAIAYETGLLDAQKEKDLAAVEAEYAQSIYDNSVARAQEEVDALQEKVDEAQEKVDEYTASIEEDYYYTYYEVAKKEAVWKDNAAFLMELYQDWDVETLQDVYKGYETKKGIGYVTNQVTASGASLSGASAGQSGTGNSAASASENSMPSGDSDFSGAAPGVSFSRETMSGVYFTEETVTSQDVGNESAETGGNDGSNGDNGGNGSGESGSDGDNDGSGSSNSGSEDSDGGAGNGSDSSGSDGDNDGNGSGSGSNDSGSGSSDSGNGSSEGSPGSGTPGQFPEGEDAAHGDGEQKGFDNGFTEGFEAGENAVISDDEIRYNIYLAMEEETEESKQLYEKALDNYESAKKTAEAGIAEAQSELTVLQAQLKEQQTAYEEAVISAKLTYDLAISDNENAQMVYESTVKQLEEEYEALKDAEEEAAQNLELFEETIGDGVFYTGSAGTVMMTMVRASQWITEDTMVIAYSNPETVTISANVDQADIASVEIGQEAFVLISGYGSYSGKVTSVDPVSSSNGSSVTYPVNVQLEGEVSELEANLTAYVYLGLTEEEKEMLDSSMNGRNGQRGESGERQDAEGGEGQGMPRDGQPEGFGPDSMPEDGFLGGDLPEGDFSGGSEMPENAGGRNGMGNGSGKGGISGGSGFGPAGGGQ